MTIAPATVKISYRKTKQNQWVVYGPANAIQAGATITVTKASRETKQETVERVGRPFTVDGVQMVYGYLATAPAPSGGTCDECGNSSNNLARRRDSSGILGMCCPRCARMAWYERSYC